MAGDDELLRGLGVTARGERELARDVIRDAAAAAAAREDARRGGDPGRVDGHVDAASIGGDGGGAGAAERGPGDGPAARELARLRDESERLDRELAAVRDALDEVRQRTLDGDAPVDAALQIAVGERRVQGLADKRDALDANLREAEENAAAEARRARAPTPGLQSPELPASAPTHPEPTNPAKRPNGAEPSRAPAAVVVREDDDFDALMDDLEGRTGARGTRGDVGETERERLIRTGVITPFDALAGYERRRRRRGSARRVDVRVEGRPRRHETPRGRRRPDAAPGGEGVRQATEAARRARAGRQGGGEEEGVAESRGGAGGAGRRRAGRRVRTRAGARPVDAGARGTRRTAATRKTPTRGTRRRRRRRRGGRRRRRSATGISSSRRLSRNRRPAPSLGGRVPRARSPTPAKGTRASCARRPGRR